MKIKIITSGKIKGDLENRFDSYIHRLGGFVKHLEIHPLKENKEFENKVLEKSKGSFLILLDERGREFDSRELADFFKHKEEMAEGDITFVVGGPDGHSEMLRRKSDLLLSMSRLTFPHDMAILFLSEMLYRSFSILNNHPYHRD